MLKRNSTRWKPNFAGGNEEHQKEYVGKCKITIIYKCIVFNNCVKKVFNMGRSEKHKSTKGSKEEKWNLYKVTLLMK